MRRLITVAVLAGLATLVWGAVPSPGAAQAAPTVAVTGQTCSDAVPGRVAVTFAWELGGARAQSVWLDLSLFDNGFAEGTYARVGPLSPGDSSFVWDGLLAEEPHYLRMYVLYADGWRAAPTVAFATGSCTSAVGLSKVTQECDDSGQVSVSFSWVPSLAVGATQWLDLTVQGASFAPGSFAGLGPLSTWRSSVTWDGLQAGVLHHWRINTFSNGEWHASPTGTFFTLACGVEDAPVSEGLLLLREQLRAAIQASGLNAAAAVTDFQTGESIDVAGDSLRLPGCTINFFVLLSVVMDVEAGHYPESEVGQLISSTTWSSNAVTGRALLLKTGGGDIRAGVEKVNDLMTSLGLETSLYDHAPAFPDLFSLRGSANILTAKEMNRGLANFYNGGIVSPAWRDYLMAKLTEVKPGLQYLIPAGVGAGTVAHKNGFFPSAGGWIDNDAGIVLFASGGRQYAYAVSFFTEDVPSKYADIPLGQTVSSLVWQYFRSRYG